MNTFVAVGTASFPCVFPFHDMASDQFPGVTIGFSIVGGDNESKTSVFRSWGRDSLNHGACLSDEVSLLSRIQAMVCTGKMLDFEYNEVGGKSCIWSQVWKKAHVQGPGQWRHG